MKLSPMVLSDPLKALNRVESGGRMPSMAPGRLGGGHGEKALHCKPFPRFKGYLWLKGAAGMEKTTGTTALLTKNLGATRIHPLPPC